MLGANALAAPVFDVSRTLVATIAILNSIQFIAHKPAEDQVRRVVGAAQRISHRLGYTG
jgi:DNA-binding IclR family transcriptional regulator